MRSCSPIRLLAFAALLVLPLAPLAQEATPYRLPVASGGHAIELVLDDTPEAFNAGADVFRVEVESAPAWVVFVSPEAKTVDAEDGPLAQLAFSVAREVSVGETGEIRLSVVSGTSVVGEKVIRVEASAPEAARLGLPRPNPSRAGATLEYEVPLASAVRLVVVDVLGREVMVLAEGDVPPGAYEARVPSQSLASGLYSVVLTVEGVQRQRQVQRLTVVR